MGKTLFVGGARGFSIYDVSDAKAPKFLSTTLSGPRFPNEDIDTNGKTLLLSNQETPVATGLEVWDVGDRERSLLAGPRGSCEGPHLLLRSGLQMDLWLARSDRRPARPQGAEARRQLGRLATERRVRCNYADGNPPASVWGCTAMWFQHHPTFRNGGLVVSGFFEHGTRFLEVGRRGMISEIGYFMPAGGSTIATYWISDTVVYAFDLHRGLDILEYTGSL